MKINQLRFSCVWTLSFLNDLDKSLLKNSSLYKACLTETLENRSENWLVPWKHNSRENPSKWAESLQKSSFWRCYFELQNHANSDYEDILLGIGDKKNRAWKDFLPLKHKNILDLKQNTGAQHIKCESFAYSCGMAVIATATIALNSDVDGYINAINAIREAKYNEIGQNNGNVYTLNEWVDKAFHKLDEIVLAGHPLKKEQLRNKKTFITMTITKADANNEFSDELPTDDNIYKLKNLVSLYNQEKKYWERQCVIQPNILHPKCYDDIKEPYVLQ